MQSDPNLDRLYRNAKKMVIIDGFDQMKLAYIACRQVKMVWSSEYWEQMSLLKLLLHYGFKPRTRQEV